ncbi:MAG: hypothetical protein EBU54_10715, partial [Mycobacteriaceae bacterium]|nr:hypothetical protein [Mycobacteriaceae bacterium]
MVLVEGENADGATVDYLAIEDEIEGGGPAQAERVLAAICGTRAGAIEGGHRLSSTGVVWTDHAAAVELRAELQARDIDNVTLVSELHAASSLARAVGQTIGWDRTALILLEDDSATLAVVRTADGEVVRARTRALPAGLDELVAGLDDLAERPEAVFLVGPGAEALRPLVAARTALPVQAPGDAEAALARGAALAAANTPRFEATTVGLGAVAAAGEDTQPAPELTHPAALGYRAPLAYSTEPRDDTGQEPYVLLGSAAMAVFVVGIVA